MTSDDMKHLQERLDKLVSLLALSVVAGKKQAEQVNLLWRAGFKPGEIASLVGTTSHTVSVTLSRLKQSSRTRRRAPKET